jgi:cytochrome c oxidase subunit 2
MTRPMRHRFTLLGLGLVPLLAGCGRDTGNENVVHPASHSQHQIAQLFWVMLIGAAIGFAFVVALLFLGWQRRARTELPGGIGEQGATKLVIGLGVALPIVLLTALFIWSDFFVMRSVAAPTKGSTALTIRVTGREWWWEVSYDGTPVVTANEIHIPTHTRVAIVGTTADVIHSFWVPELNRKIDLTPGYTSRLLLQTDKPGIYRGQCSEFCGLQHAHMVVFVIAEPMPQFRRWLAANAKPAPASALPGRKVFERAACGDCHQIRGTSAHGVVGPDLTHVGGRLTLAAGTIANTRQNLDRWIRDPQHYKPGNKMPDLRLSDRDWRALDAYLRTLR